MAAVSQAEYARARGVSREAVRKAIKTGRISTVDGRQIDPAVADAEWAAHTKARIDAGTPSTQTAREGDGDYRAHRARREKIEADRAALALAKERGELINKEGAFRALETAARLLRDAVLGVPDRLPLPREQQLQVRDALTAALIDVAKALPEIGARATSSGLSG